MRKTALLPVGPFSSTSLLLLLLSRYHWPAGSHTTQAHPNFYDTHTHTHTHTRVYIYIYIYIYIYANTLLRQYMSAFCCLICIQFFVSVQKYIFLTVTCHHRYIIGVRGRGLPAEASGCNQCNAGSESPESWVLDQPLCPGLLHLLLRLLHPLSWRRQNS